MEEIETIEIDKNRKITYANALIKAKYQLSLTAKRLLLVLSSKVQAEDHDFKTYRFKTKELFALIGIKRNGDAYKRFDKATDELMDVKITFSKEDSLKIQNGKTRFVSWSEYVRIKSSKETFIDLRFDVSMKEYYLALKGYFTSYVLDDAVKLPSFGAIRFYEILKMLQFRDKKTRKAFRKTSLNKKLTDFQTMLGLENKYPKFGNFNKSVLKKYQELFETETDIRFEYEPIKTGSKVTDLKLIIYQKTEEEIGNKNTKNISKNTDKYKKNISASCVAETDSDKDILLEYNLSSETIQQIRSKLNNRQVQALVCYVDKTCKYKDGPKQGQIKPRAQAGRYLESLLLTTRLDSVLKVAESFLKDEEESAERRTANEEGFKAFLPSEDTKPTIKEIVKEVTDKHDIKLNLKIAKEAEREKREKEKQEQDADLFKKVDQLKIKQQRTLELDREMNENRITVFNQTSDEEREKYLDQFIAEIPKEDYKKLIKNFGITKKNEFLIHYIAEKKAEIPAQLQALFDK